MGRYSATSKTTGTTDRKTSRRLVGGMGGSSGSAALSSDGFQLRASAPAPVAKPGGFTGKTSVPTPAGPTIVPDAPKAYADGNFRELANVLGTLNTNLNNAITSGLAYATSAEELARKEAESIADQYPEEEEEEEEEEENPDEPDDEENPDEPDDEENPDGEEIPDGEEQPDDDGDVDGSKSLKQLSSRLENVINEKKKGSDEYKYSEEERSGASDLLNKIGNNRRVERHLKSIYNRNDVRDRALNINQLASEATVTNKEGKEVPLSSVPSSSRIYKEWYRKTVYGDTSLSPLEYQEVQSTLVNSRATDIKRQDKAHHGYQIDQYETEKTIVLAKAGNQIALGNTAAATEDIQGLLDMLTPLLPGATKQEQALLKKGLVEGLTTAFLNSDIKHKDEEELLTALKGLFIGPANDRNIVQKKDGVVVEDKDGLPVTIPNEKLRWINQEGGEDYLKNIIADVKNDLLDQDNKEDKFQKNQGEERANTEFNKQVLPLLQTNKINEARLKIAELSKAYQKDAIASKIDPDIQGEVVGHYNDLIKDYLSTDDATIADEQIQISRSLLAAATDSSKIWGIEANLELMEEKYSHNKDVLEFVRKQRDKLSNLKKAAASPYIKEFERLFEVAKRGFMETAGDESSYGDDPTDPNPEATMVFGARSTGLELANEIIADGMKKGKSGKEIIVDLQKAITRETLGLIYKSELKPAVIKPTYKNLGEFNDSHKWLRGDIKNPQPNDINELNKAIQSKQPMFPKHTIDFQIRNILTSIKTDPKNPKIDKRIRLLLKASGKPLSEFFIEQLTKNGETVSPELIEVLEALDKVKL